MGRNVLSTALIAIVLLTGCAVRGARTRSLYYGTTSGVVEAVGRDFIVVRFTRIRSFDPDPKYPEIMINVLRVYPCAYDPAYCNTNYFYVGRKVAVILHSQKQLEDPLFDAYKYLDTVNVSRIPITLDYTQ